MRRLSKNEILRIHELVLAQNGGLTGLRDENLLESALNAPFQTFAQEPLYANLESQAARLGMGLIQNHPFIDGNKRTGLLVMLVFLQANGRKFQSSNEDLIDLGLGIASGKYDFQFTEIWVRKHLIPKE